MAHPGAWLFKKQKNVGIGGLFGSTSRKKRRKSRKRRPAVRGRAFTMPRKAALHTASVMGRGFGALARMAGGAGKKAGIAAYSGAKGAYERRERYIKLREKARRYGFKNLSHEEKNEYSKAALTKGHQIEG